VSGTAATAANARAARTRNKHDRWIAELATAGYVTVGVDLLRSLTDPDDCSFDHHGGCQAHGFLSLEPGELCPHAEAKQVLHAVSGHTCEEPK
jgi:hypothetical protein